jgi:DHA2 family multidrug resistance protein
VLWVGSLQIMLDKGKELDWFHSGQIIALALAAAIGFVVFLIWELTEEHPVVDLRLFARRNFSLGSATLAIAYGLFFGNVVLLPLWLQQFMGYTATAAGMALAPVGLFAIILSPVVGRQMSRMDPRWLTTIAFLVFSLVLWMRANFTTQTDQWTVLVPTIIQGIAVACFFIPLMGITLSGLTPDRIPAASGLSNFARITAGAFGTSIATTVWDDRATMHHAHLVEQLGNIGSPALADALGKLGSGGLGLDQASAQIVRLIDQQAFTRSADDVFLFSSVMFLGLIGLIWFARPVRASAPADGGGAH